jgi:hypothetical protein
MNSQRVREVVCETDNQQACHDRRLWDFCRAKTGDQSNAAAIADTAPKPIAARFKPTTRLSLL